jgi:ABC-type transporter Mla maintaining outer membrane lipid asymmetry ATPase subunit MlaF
MPSSVIQDYRYYPAERRLEILFQTGRLYSYLEVPQDIYIAMKASFSKGEFFNAFVRDRFRFVRESERSSASRDEEL